MELSVIVKHSFYFLALINPASKIFLLSTQEPALTTQELRCVVRRSSFVALIILVLGYSLDFGSYYM